MTRRQPLKGWGMKMWEWSLSCNGDHKDIRDSRNMEYLSQKTTGKEWSQPKSKACGLQMARHGSKMPKIVGAHTMRPQAPYARHGNTGLSVFLVDFWSCFGLILPFYSSILSILPDIPNFWNGNICSVVSWKHVTCFII
jgi:hypothetical protein